MSSKILSLVLTLILFSGCSTRIASEQDTSSDINRQNPVDTIADTKEENSSERVGEKDGNILNIPLENALSRVTKKPFGIYITPKNSPVQPERFRGYHTGVDFEILPGEENTDVPVYAICTGDIVFKSFVKGYGGVLIQECTWKGAEVTVLYGHVRLSSISLKPGQKLQELKPFAVLGTGYTQETDGERKHLHVAIHKGSDIEFRGYVDTREAIDTWIDSMVFLKDFQTNK